MMHCFSVALALDGAISLIFTERCVVDISRRLVPLHITMHISESFLVQMVGGFDAYPQGFRV